LLQCVNVKLKLKRRQVRDRIASGYLRGTTYLWTPFFGKIPVATLFVKGAEAVCPTTKITNAYFLKHFR